MTIHKEFLFLFFIFQKATVSIYYEILFLSTKRQCGGSVRGKNEHKKEDSVAM